MQYITTPQEAEANAALRMRKLGFTDARVTAGGADGGIDVRSSAALAQVKWRGGMVGRPELQALFGARGSDFSKQLLFFAASGYSQHAVEYADHSQIALFVYEPTGTLVPKNQHATRILHGGHHSVVGQAPRNEPALHSSTSVEPAPGILAPGGVAVLENALAHHRSSRLHDRNFLEYLERHFATGGTDKRGRRSRADHVSSRLTAFLVAVRDRSRTEDIRETTGQRS